MEEEDDVQTDMVKVSRKEIMFLVRRIQGFQNIQEEKESEVKHLRQQCQLLQTKLDEMQKNVNVKNNLENNSVRKTCETEKHLNHSRSVEPEIFLFPDTKHSSLPAKQTSFTSLNQSSSLDVDGITQQEPGLVQAPFAHTSGEGLHPGPILSYTGAQTAGVNGVSEQYFLNLMNEIVKTKKYLHNLQQKQALAEMATEAQINELEKENLHLKEVNSQLQITIKNFKEKEDKMLSVAEMYPCQNADTRKFSVLHEDADDSLELKPSKEDVYFTEISTQTDLDIAQVTGFEDETTETNKVLIEKLEQENMKLEELVKDLEYDTRTNLKMEINQLKEERDQLEKELEQRNTDFKDMEKGVDVLSKCMQDEKKRNKQLEQQLQQEKQINSTRNKQLEQQLEQEKQTNSTVRIKLCEQVAHLRQENGTLLEELGTLRKQFDHLSSIPRPISSPTMGAIGQSSSSCKPLRQSKSDLSDKISNLHENQSIFHEKTSPANVSKFQKSSQSLSNPSTNDLNAGDISSRSSPRLRYSGSDSGSGFGYDVTGRGQVDYVYQPRHQESWSCPRCSQMFHDDDKYLKHMSKCLDD